MIVIIVSKFGSFHVFYLHIVFHDLCVCLRVFVQVPPTRMNLQTYKGKQVAAKKGYDLLKSKADALKVQKIVVCVCMCVSQ